MEKIFELEIDVNSPFNFDLTVNKFTLFGTDWYLMSPFEVYKRGNLWTAFVLNNEKPVGLHIKSLGTVEKPRIVVEAFSSEKSLKNEKEEVLETVLFSLGVEKDLNEFYDFANNNAVLRKVVSDLYGMRLTSLPDLFSLVILAITLQRASYGRTEKMVEALYENYGVRVKFDNVEVVACPSARKVAKVSEEELREKCRLGYRASYLRYNANLIANGEIPPLRELGSLSSIEEAKKILRKMRGIGEYSSEIILFSLYPCFPVDSWSAENFAKVFKIESSSRSLIETVRAYAERNFGEWQSYVYDYIINDVENLGLS